MAALVLTEYIPGQIWLKEYPIRYAGTEFRSRMTVIRLSDDRLMIHSPCEINKETKAEIETLGQVRFIVAPGSFHHLYVASAQIAFPQAETFICPGIERKQPRLEFDWILSNRPDPRWQNVFEQALVRGTTFMWEVAFFHIPSRTLILVDLIENFTDRTPGVDWRLRLWFRFLFRMWNWPKPAPEYQLGWGNRRAVGKSLERILEWDYSRVVLAHGDLIESDAKAILREAWKTPLAHA